MREANDRGYECLLIEDATESYFPEFKAATIEMIAAQGGIVGWVTSLTSCRRHSRQRRRRMSDERFDPDAMIDALAPLLGLPVEDDYRPGIASQPRGRAAHRPRRARAFELDDEAEPAPVSRHDGSVADTTAPTSPPRSGPAR